VNDGASDDYADRAAEAFARHRALAWHVSYRMLGVPADADDTVQEAFVRMLQRRPELESDPWLPGAIADDDPRMRDTPELGAEPDRRYTLLETLSLGFLLAAEKLTPSQRAILVLRDVFGFTTRETAHALEITESNVKVTLHRARAVMRGWEEGPRRRLAAPAESVVAAMMRFFTLIVSGDVDAAEAMLAEDVVTLNDGGGEFFAAGKPVVGRAKVTRFYANIARSAKAAHIEVKQVNGAPTLVVQREGGGPRDAPLSLTQIDLDEHGRIIEIRAVLARRKVAALTS
jgi:RNA polymerase sigma-70 factor (ECF subfamily)